MKSPALHVLLALLFGAPLSAAQLLRQRTEPARYLKHVVAGKLGKHGSEVITAKGHTIVAKKVEETKEGPHTGSDSNVGVLVRFDVQLSSSSNGSFVMEVRPDWAPIGAERFLALVDGIGPSKEPNPDVSGDAFWSDLRFFRVIDNFMAQFGIAGDPEVSKVWRSATIPDDPVVESNQRGYVSFAMAGPNTRTTQFFINYKDNSRLDKQGFAPFAKVVKGMEVVDDLYKAYGDRPRQGYIQNAGNTFLQENFPNLSYITSVQRIDSIDDVDEKENELE